MPPSPPAPPTPTPLLCGYCHQPILPSYYYCPNCGTKVTSATLSTSLGRQAWIYIFSAILPMMGFILVTRWPGLKYYKSSDQKAKDIGTFAFIILIVSTLITIWLAYTWTQYEIQATISGLNADTSANGN